LNNEPGIVLTYQRSWRAFVSGDIYSGTILRVQPQAAQSIVNLTGGASEGVLLEI